LKLKDKEWRDFLGNMLANNSKFMGWLQNYLRYLADKQAQTIYIENGQARDIHEEQLTLDQRAGISATTTLVSLLQSSLQSQLASAPEYQRKEVQQVLEKLNKVA